MEGGLEQIPLKYENGARFSSPSLEIVETNAMGRGTIDPIISLCVSCSDSAFGSRIIILSIYPGLGVASIIHRFGIGCDI